jgi:hypothetical protein
MQKIDRLGWTAGLSFTSFGVRMGVRANSEDALERALLRLPAGWKPSRSNVVERLYSLADGGGMNRRGVRRFSLLFGDITRLARSLDTEEVFDTFESDLRLHVAARARGRAFVHAGVVGWNDKAILIPGRSMSGKTTLVAELVRAGATYYSDEFAVLDERGRVHPFPKPLAMRKRGALKQTNYEVEHFGGSNGVKPLPVALVVVCRYGARKRWRPRRLTAGEGMLALLDNAVSARREPEKALSALREVVLRAPVLKGVRGEASETAEMVLRSLDAK